MLFSLITTSCNSQNNNGHVHDYSKEWTIDKEATCTEDGSKSHHCLICDKKIDETVIKATGHSFSKYEYDEFGHWQKCDRCGYVTNKTNHDYQIKENSTLKCICGKEKQIEGNLIFTLSEDKTSYMVSGFNENPSKIVNIPSEHNGLPVLSIVNSAFFNNDVIEKVYISLGITTIGADAFSECGSLTSIEIPNSVISIGSNAFSSCSSLTSIEIPSSVTSIGSSAFNGCSSLESIKIPDNITMIEEFTFSNCSSLKTIDLPTNLTSIEHFAFFNCKHKRFPCII